MSEEASLQQLADLMRLAATTVRILEKRQGEGSPHLLEARQAILNAAAALDAALNQRLVGAQVN